MCPFIGVMRKYNIILLLFYCQFSMTNGSPALVAVVYPPRNEITTGRVLETTSSTVPLDNVTAIAFAFGTFTGQQSRFRVCKTTRCIRLMFATAVYNRQQNFRGTNRKPAARDGRKTVRRPVMILLRSGYKWVLINYESVCVNNNLHLYYSQSTIIAI